jgi:hypothetical protein
MIYATRRGVPITLPHMAYESPLGDKAKNPGLETELDEHQKRIALRLFRAGRDNVEIASAMEVTPAAVANGIARARDEERRAVA